MARRIVHWDEADAYTGWRHAVGGWAGVTGIWVAGLGERRFWQPRVIDADGNVTPDE